MPKRDGLIGTRAQNGHKVSHSNIKTKKRFEPNLQRVTVISDALGRGVPLRITTATLRTIDHNGGLDAYLLSTSDTKLTEEAARLKRRIKKALKAKAGKKAA